MQALNRGYSETQKKGWIKAIILVIAWLIIVSLVKDLWQIKRGYGRIEETKSRLAEEEKKNIILKDKLDVVTTDAYKEKVIREQLNMQKVGEVVAVLPKGNQFEDTKEQAEEKTESNWDKWWALLK